MFRIILFLLIFLSSFACLFAQVSPADSLFLIPCGPIAGTFTPEARITVNDTIAGWAKIQVEGWVPVAVVAGYLKTRTDTVHAPQVAAPSALPQSGQEPKPCEAITKKGNRCTRNAKSGSKYCWQHQSYNPDSP